MKDETIAKPFQWFRIYTHYYKDAVVRRDAENGELVRIGEGDVTEECLGEFKDTSVWRALEQAWQWWESGSEAVITERSSMVGDGMRVEFLTELNGLPTMCLTYTLTSFGFRIGFSNKTSLLHG